MSIKIKPLRKFATGTPSTSDMVEGEIAVNTADKKVFMRDDSNNIVEVGAASSLSLPITCLLYTSPSPRDLSTSRMPSSA